MFKKLFKTKMNEMTLGQTILSLFVLGLAALVMMFGEIHLIEKIFMKDEEGKEEDEA